MSEFTVAVVGGGLVGALTAVTLAKNGWNVEVYELRNDLRKEKQNNGRGIEPLKEAGVHQSILNTVIPMKGRMIHSLDGKQTSQPYGVFGECINSVNDHLLDEAEKLPNVKIYFHHTLDSIDFDEGILTFKLKNGDTVSTKKVDLIIGADGAFSKTRMLMQKKIRMNYSQEYINHGWLELTIPPGKDGNYLMNPEHLHIWPRQTFMLIALPNTDKSFTVTLFMPWEKFENIKTKDDLLAFFEENFPDCIPLMCKPYHYSNKAVLIGDAAHAMVPFYGQGMNCGFEDVSILNATFKRNLIDLKKPTPAEISKSLLDYSNNRAKDAHAICDLALYNYTEMSSGVTKLSYLIRKKLETVLHKIIPSSVIPLYTMVSFSRIPYSEVIKRWKRQSYWINFSGKFISSLLFCGIIGLGLKYNQKAILNGVKKYIC
ncbi:kynurenine 3-monooxygenase, mitochondrial precursor [Clydaea vesicula]|uniref:Kynurenine 3-monooxygenase n=1 Tax=Clydaea vesicula TaxID=447962 RepID=A0AAD5U6A6_9FUNG|nr:kynurenine 3-monooxygenase, mitochondrial precursor [Clydaea vesicula]